ncbi:hypothetical protein Hanom_Chr13g01231531 [Helianthus anomalus]
MVWFPLKFHCSLLTRITTRLSIQTDNVGLFLTPSPSPVHRITTSCKLPASEN